MKKYYYIDIYEKDDSIKMSYYPEEFLLIAEPNANFRLYKTEDLGKGDNLPSGVNEIIPELQDLLYCSEGYKPSIAIVRDKISLLYDKTKNISKEDFSQLYFDLLKEELKNQPYKKYFISEVIYEDSSYFSKGEFVWVIGYNPDKKTLQWVSFDFFIYVDHINCFKIDSNLLNVLPNFD